MGADEDRARRATADGDGFVGRGAELALLDEALAEVGAAGDGARCVVVEGAPGIGKTALLTRFLAGVGAGDGAAGAGAGAGRTALATADASEQLVAYALADQLLRALGVERPDVLAPAGGAPGFAAVGLRLLETFAGGGEDSAPTVVVVDDAQWADEPSLRALLFATRR
ncbi:MAG TPA: ATP-binding protein, partial [Conexibacter sp.]|nr:ATP-binding protein [Conexibacter sp.]